jgi:small-conductance mechanosensitive channel
MEKTQKFSTIILWGLMIISIVLFAIMVLSIDSQSNPGPKAVANINLNINWAIALFAIAAVVAVLFALTQMFSEKGKAIQALIVLGLMAAVVFVSYSLASSTIPQFYGVEKFVADKTLTESISRWVGTGLNVTYILFASAFLSIIGFGVASIFKR